MATTVRWLQEGFRRHEAGDLDGAEALYQRLLRKAPEHAEALYLLGSIYLQRGAYAKAVARLEHAVSRDSGQARYFNNLGLALMALQRLAEAGEACRQALVLQPEYPQASYTLGQIEKDREDWPAAQAHFAQAAALRPDWPEAIGLLGTILNNRGYPEEALPHLQRAVALGADEPKDRCLLRGNLGVCLAALGRFAEARTCYEQVLAEEPSSVEAHLNLGLLLLLHGETERGLAEYEWRLQTPFARQRTESRPRWDGTPLAGRTLLVHAEQGYGDTFQFIRYLPLIPRHDGRVLFECQPGTRSLLAGCEGFDALIERPASNLPEDRPAHDVQIPLASLPFLFPHPTEAPPGRAPYLRASPERMTVWGERLTRLCAALPGHGPDTLKVGLVWAGNPGHKNDHNRSASLSDFAPLASLPGVTLFSLQVGSPRTQAADPPAGMTLVDLADFLVDFDETAAALCHMDLLIAVDTSVIHLAGALGRPAWLLTPFIPDFRWLLAREDSPWYPTLRLFRQPRLRDWASVLHRVAGELQTAASARAALLSQIETAEMLYTAGDVSGATDLLQRLADTPLPHPRVLNDLGVIYWRRGATVEALTAFLRALEVAPHDATAQRNCADVLAVLEPARRAA